VVSSIAPGTYVLEYIFINNEGEVGFNYGNWKDHPEFTGEDLRRLTEHGHITFNS